MCIGQGDVWTDTSYRSRDEDAYTFEFGGSSVSFSVERKRTKVPVRPFYKVLPKK